MYITSCIYILQRNVEKKNVFALLMFMAHVQFANENLDVLIFYLEFIIFKLCYHSVFLNVYVCHVVKYLM